MNEPSSRGRWLWLLVLGICVGWFEAAVVIDLRELYYPNGFDFPVVEIPARMGLVEIVREVASLFLLAAGARLAGRSFLERFAAFMFLFGVWDLVYYAVLKGILDWPASWSTWDVLFLLPYPWVGPVWAPCVVSVALVGFGTWIYLTSGRERRYSAFDWGIEIVAGLIVIASFVARGSVVLNSGRPVDYPAWLFWIGWGMGVGWFIRREWTGAAAAAAKGNGRVMA